MARVSEASTTGPEGVRSTPSPLGKVGAEGGLSKLIRSAGVSRVSSKSKATPLGPTSGVIRSYMSVRRLLEAGGCRLSEVGGEEQGTEVRGGGEATSATK